MTAAFEMPYAKPPGNRLLSSPAIDEMLMMEPPRLAATNRFATALDMSHVPRKFVFKMVFHSLSSWFNGDRTGPARNVRD